MARTDISDKELSTLNLAPGLHSIVMAGLVSM